MEYTQKLTLNQWLIHKIQPLTNPNQAPRMNDTSKPKLSSAVDCRSQNASSIMTTGCCFRSSQPLCFTIWGSTDSMKNLYNLRAFCLLLIFFHSLALSPVFNKNSANEIPKPLRIEFWIDSGDGGGVSLQGFVSMLKLLTNIIILQNVNDPKV